MLRAHSGANHTLISKKTPIFVALRMKMCSHRAEVSRNFCKKVFSSGAKKIQQKNHAFILSEQTAMNLTNFFRKTSIDLVLHPSVNLLILTKSKKLKLGRAKHSNVNKTQPRAVQCNLCCPKIDFSQGKYSRRNHFKN